MATSKTASPTEVVTGKVRLSYVHLFEPYSQNPDQDAKYSTVILIPKSDTTTLKKLERAREAAIEAGRVKKFNGSVPKNLKTTLHDGDEEADLDKNPEYKGHMYMTVSSRQKPGIVDQNVNAILDSTEVYSGCYAKVALNAYAYNTQGNRGVSFGLSHVQKLGDGAPLVPMSKPEDVFTAVDDSEDEESFI